MVPCAWVCASSRVLSCRGGERQGSASSSFVSPPSLSWDTSVLAAWMLRHSTVPQKRAIHTSIDPVFMCVCVCSVCVCVCVCVCVYAHTN
jgi:hypothetical protein